MSNTNDKKRHYKTIDKTCYTANTIYLIVHIFYLILFIVSKLDILTYVTAGVVVIYLLFYLLIRAKKYYLYALICGNEFFAYISFVTVMIGFAAGFPFYLIGLCVVSFFTSYFSKVKSVKGSIVWVVLSLTIYLTLYFITKFNTPYYAIEKWLEVTLFTTHSIAVFAFIAAYLVVFIRFALSLERKIMNESRTDELTQISNRYGLYDYFNEEDKTSKVLALLDIDNFKIINDKNGHVAGDYILKKVAEITTLVLTDGFVCRYGGEEFVMVIKDEEANTAFDKLEILRRRIENEKFEFEGEKMNVTVTIGAVKYKEGIKLEKWVELADEKMYSGKNTGKNKTVI